MSRTPRLLVLVLVALLAALPPRPTAAQAGSLGGAAQHSGPVLRSPAVIPSAAPPGGRRVFGYYVPYDTTSWESLEANAGYLTDVAAQWVTVDACGQIGSRDDQTLKGFARARGIRVLPSLLTGSGWLNHRLLTDEAVSARAIGQIVDYVAAEGYEGFDLDLEGVRSEDRAAYTDFVARVATALHERGKLLTLAIPPKPVDATTGWAGAYEYAALGAHADLITIMAYEYSGPFSGPGSVAPYDAVERVTAFATSQIPAEKVLLGLAFYGHDWNTTSGGSRALSYARAAALAERYAAPIALDPGTQSATFRYRAPAGEAPPTRPSPPDPGHEITRREPPPCPVETPAPAPTATPRPSPPPDAIQEHEVWLEESASATARLGLAERYGAGGVATWRLGLEDPRVWPALERWRTSLTPSP